MRYLWVLLLVLLFVPSPQAQVATSLGSGLFQCNSSGTAKVTATAQSGIGGTATLNCFMAGSGSLLPGCTVSASNTVQNCTNSFPPAGWTLAIAQGFDNGPIGPNEYTLGSASISTAHFHTGQHSWGTLVTGDGSDNSWGVNGGAVGIGTEFYISYWSYYDPNATLSTEHYFSAARTGTNDGCVADYGGNSGANTYVTTLVVQTLCGGSTWAFNDNNTTTHTLNAGTWEQDEWHFKPSSCSGSTVNSDGISQLWANGTLVINDVNIKIQDPTQGNPCSPAVNWSGMNAEAGGTFTYFINGTRTNPITSQFNAYIDDVIVLHK